MMRSNLLVLSLVVVGIAGAQSWSAAGRQVTYPALPARSVDVSVFPVVANTITVGCADSLQTALTTAAALDSAEVVLDIGCTWSGNFIMPARAPGATGWVVVRPSDWSVCPERGTRVSSGAALPVIETPNTLPALANDLNNASPASRYTHHWWVSCVEITRTQSFTWALVRVTSVPDSPQPMDEDYIPEWIVFDRVNIHGEADQAVHVGRGMQFEVDYGAVIDSIIDEIHDGVGTSEQQALWGTSMRGPLLVRNTLLGASTENVLFGGNYGAYPGIFPCDIRITGNYIRKNVAWRTYSPLPPAKNLLELKVGCRVLIDNNLLRTSWSGGQNGAGIVLTVRSQQSGILSAVEDVSAINNILDQVGLGVSALVVDDHCPALNTSGDVSGVDVTALAQTFRSTWGASSPPTLTPLLGQVFINNGGPYYLTRVSNTAGTLSTALGTLAGARVVSAWPCRPQSRILLSNMAVNSADSWCSGSCSAASLLSAAPGQSTLVPSDWTLDRISENTSRTNFYSIFWDFASCGPYPIGQNWAMRRNILAKAVTGSCGPVVTDTLGAAAGTLLASNALIGASGATAAAWTSLDASTTFPSSVTFGALGATVGEPERSRGQGANLACFDVAAVEAGTPRAYCP